MYVHSLAAAVKVSRQAVVEFGFEPGVEVLGMTSKMGATLY